MFNPIAVSTPRPIPWPTWPETDERSGQSLAVSLLAGRLAVSAGKSHWVSRNQYAAREVARRSGRRHAVLTTSGSSATVVALHLLGIGPGDTVAMTATTWVSCATSVLRVGATPVFFDASPDSPCGTADDLAEAPSAILAIHLYAQHVDIADLRNRFPGVPIIEDASHSQFARTSADEHIGSFGDITIMSLQASKIITSGEGGAVLTDDPTIAERLQSLVMDSRRWARQESPTAPNELEPAHLLHGANHSPPETSAAFLLDQLDRFDRQAERRSENARRFIDHLADSGWRTHADPGAVSSGAFYGLAVAIPDGAGSPEDVISHVQRRTGLVLDRVYPPVTEGPLYRPETIKQFSAIAPEPRPTPVSHDWHTRHVVVPHHAFLANARQIEHLAAELMALSAPAGAVAPVAPTASRLPVIDVVLITKGYRPTLEAALTSIVRQDVAAEVRTMVLVDGSAMQLPELSAEVEPDSLIEVESGSALPSHPFERIAALRDLAIKVCGGDYVAFLDDDNTWEEKHLSSLLELAEQGYPAVHSWRMLVDSEGSPTSVDRFPWLPPGARADSRLRSLIAANVMAIDSSVVCDRVEIELPEGTGGMVDMGEWLFDRRLLNLLSFQRPRTETELADRLGEDDILLEQITRLGIPVRCTDLPTLRYRLGGMSSPEYGVVV